MKFRLSIMLAVAWKELQVRAQDRGSLAILFLLPLLFGSMLGSMGQASMDAEGEEGVAFEIYMVNEDDGPYGKQVVDILRQIPVLEMTVLRSSASADKLIADGERMAAIVIPAGFSDKVEAYEQATVEVIVDPVQEQYASTVSGLVNYAVSPVVVLGEVQHGIRMVLDQSGVLESASPELQAAMVAQTLGAIMTRLQALETDPTIALAIEDLEGGEASPLTSIFSLVIPGFAVSFAFWLTGVIGTSLHMEKDQGSFRRLVAAPISRVEIIGGNVLAFMSINFLQVLVLFGIAAGVFDMPIGEQPFGLFVMTLTLSICVSAFGLMLGSLTKSAKQVDTLAMVLGFVLAGLGGALVYSWPPVYRQDTVMGFLSRLTPHAHALQGFNLLMIDGVGLGTALPEVGVLLGMAVVFFGVAAWKLDFD